MERLGCLVAFVASVHAAGSLAVTSDQEDQFDAYQENLNLVWLMQNFIGVLLMQAGFAMLEAGSVQVKNTRNIMLKNVVDSFVSAISFYAIGYALSFGVHDDGDLGFSGYYHFFLYDYEGFNNSSGFAFWCFMWAFCSASVTIVSGAMAERTTLMGYTIYAAYHAAVVYPVVAHWVWSPSGWITAYSPNAIGGVGFIDFAGSAVVHVVGGVAGLVGAYVVGPRIGRFDPISRAPRSIAGYSISIASIGGLILWYGWFNFNGGSTLTITDGKATLAARAMANTAIAPCFSTAVVLIYALLFRGDAKFFPALNGMLSGLVAITGACSVVEPYAAAITGCIAGVVYIVSATFVLRALRVDDPLDVVAVHGCSGVLGVFVPVLFAKKQFIEDSFGYPVDSESAGLLYGGDGRLFGVQLLGLLCIVCWTATLSWMMFRLLSIADVLRLSRRKEETGMDEKYISTSEESWASILLVRDGATTNHRLRLT